MKGSSIIGLQVGITSGASLYIDGKIIFAVSEERFTKVKNETSFPVKSIERIFLYIKENNLSTPDCVTIASENIDFNHYLMRRECTFSVADYIKEQHEYYYPLLYNQQQQRYKDIFPEKYSNVYLSDEQLDRLFNSNETKKTFKEIRKELISRYCNTQIEDIYVVNHEFAHAAYGLYASPKNFRDEDTLIITIDGYGDDGNCSIWQYNKKDKLEKVKVYKNFNIGRLYRYITLLLGMKVGEHEYKVMGLAPYASEYEIERAFSIFKDSFYFDEIDGEVKYNKEVKDHYFFFKEKLEGCRFDGVAGALQKFTEENILKLVKFWMHKLDKKKIVLSGGVSLNIKANKLISELDCVEDFFVPASGGDESLCMGSTFAYLDSIGKSESIQSSSTVYLGTENYENKDKIKKFVEENHEFLYEENFSNKNFAKYLSQGKIIGRFVGRMEFGARSLGNRAILADPSKKDVLKNINSKIKKRDFWMPFTPSILDEDEMKFLKNPKNIKFPYMTIACDTHENVKEKIFGALHPADHTARPQIVTKESNSRYWDLIKEFKKISGFGVLLNTSLNISGLPICESVDDVFNVLLKTEIDAVVINDVAIIRK